MPDFNFDEDIVLEDDVVLLKPLKSSHYEELSTIAFKYEDLLQFSPNPIFNEEYLKKYIADAQQQRESKNRYAFVVELKKTARLVGSTSYCTLSNYNKDIEIGYTWYDKIYHGSGINIRCKFLLLSYVFNVLDFDRVAFRTDERNIASRKAIEKIGAIQEGIFRRHTLLYDGFKRNTVFYSILREEWGFVSNKLNHQISLQNPID